MIQTATPVQLATPRPEKAPEEGGIFRVEEGFHYDDGPPGCRCEGCVTRWEGGAADCDHKIDPKRSGPGALEPNASSSIPKHCKCGATLTGGGNHKYVSYGSYVRNLQLEAARSKRPANPLPPEEYHEDKLFSKLDLCARLNGPGLMPSGSRIKVSRVKTLQSTPQQVQLAKPPEPFPLERMTYAQLLSVADELKLDASQIKGRDKLLEAIKAAHQKQ